jgi:hypothetical protein
MEPEQLIEYTGSDARISLTYKGTPAAGMLAWLDSTELTKWWKADSAIVEPFPGGMFYLTWSEHLSSKQHAVYGIMEQVDVENNIIQISKIMYISPVGKMGHLHLHIHFETVNLNESRMQLIHTHNYTGQTLKLYVASVKASWPKTFSLLKKHLESGTNQEK